MVHLKTLLVSFKDLYWVINQICAEFIFTVLTLLLITVAICCTMLGISLWAKS